MSVIIYGLYAVQAYLIYNVFSGDGGQEFVNNLTLVNGPKGFIKFLIFVSPCIVALILGMIRDRKEFVAAYIEQNGGEAAFKKKVKWKCPKCGTENSAGAAKCKKCGTAKPKGATKKKKKKKKK